MGTDGDGYNFYGNGWGWLDFPLPCRSLSQIHNVYDLKEIIENIFFGKDP